MQDEPASAIRQRTTDHFVCQLHRSSRRLRSHLERISLYGVAERNAALAADRLAEEGFLVRHEEEGEPSFSLAEAGRVALAKCERYPSEAA